MFDWTTSDPDTMWLTVTNVALGLCVLICVGVFAMGVARDMLAKARARVSQREVFLYDAHAMMMPDLGLTMADGGEPITNDEPESESGKKN